MISGYNYLKTFNHTTKNIYESFDIGCSHEKKAKIYVHDCNTSSSNTFIVFNPRNEYLQNLYHSMEEIFSLYQTAKILKTDIKLMDVVFINPKTVNTRYIELFKLLVRNVYIRKSISKKLCYIEPLRACSGSYLPLSWSPITAKIDLLSLDIVNHMMRNIPIQPPKQILLMTRQSANYRKLTRKYFFLKCLNKTKYNVKLFQNLKEITMKQQIKLVAESYALIGPHGAGLTLGMFLPPRGILVEISDIQNVTFRSVNNIYRNIAHFTNHKHYYLNTYERTCNRLLSILC